MTGRVDGLEEVLGRLNTAIDEIGGGTRKGLLEGGLLVQRRSQERIPVDTGNAKGSAYTRKTPEDPDVVEVGYGADYALPLHENLEARHENGQAKFLESALHDSETEILDAVQRDARVDE